MGKFNRFQLTSSNGWKGTTKDNHLGAIFQKFPQKASDMMVQLLAYNRGKSLESFLAQFPTKTFENDEEYVWQVIGSSRRNIPLVEARDENGNVVTANSANVGAGTAPFYLVFAEDWFADGETIVGNLNEAYPVKVLGDGRIEGGNTVYKVETTGGNTEGIPAERLLAGEKFSVEAAYVENSFSRKVGDVRFASPVSMRNEFSTIRIQHKVGGSMLNKKLWCGIPVVDNNGIKQTVDMWMHYVDYQVEEQFSEYKNNAIMFGRSNRNSNGEYMNFGKSGNAIKQGAGLLEQMEVSNTMYYNDFSLKLIEDALYELSAAKLGFGDRHFVIHTGERGAILLHKAIKQEISGWTNLTINADNLGMVGKTSSPLHANALKGGYQYTEWYGPNGVHVSIQVDPWYDDMVRNKVQHPNGGVAQSYRFDIFDIGTMDQPNIQKCVVGNQPEYRGYQWGPFRNPFTGGTNNPYASYDEDSAVIHKMATLGVCVLDPTRTMSIIPAILQG